MDVTSLLNGNLASSQQERDVLRLPTRSRTPWDAGGYSLPFNTKSATTSPVQSSKNIQKSPSESISHTNYDDSRLDTTQTSPTHKLSDSRSSLSSFTSSSHSVTHSRLSSVSTVDSYHTMSYSSGGQSLSPILSTQSLDMTSSLQSEDEFVPNSRAESQLRDSSSPTKPLDTLAVIAEHHNLNCPRQLGQECHNDAQQSDRFGLHDDSQMILIKEAQGESKRGKENESSQDGKDEKERKFWVNGTKDLEARGWVNDRPSSPSDTLLIKRPTIQNLYLNIREQDHNPLSLITQHKYIGVDSRLSRTTTHTKYHKRALSAPNFAASMAAIQGSKANENTPPPSHHSDQNSPPPFGYSAPDTPPDTAPNSGNIEPVCMYIEDCDTGSQQRKAISHIFGRNKMCTRQIPEHVWVHLCRKHYQRSRYRNATAGYAKVQCDLVQEQIRRIHEWSDGNLATGRGPFVPTWTLALRKREQKRIEEQGSAKRKRTGQDEIDNMGRDDIGYPKIQTAVPDWLLNLVGQDFNTDAILQVFNRLHQHIVDHTVPFPDIEILPNVVVGQDDPKPVTRPSHQRAQSLSVQHESSFRDHTSKRRRQNELASLGATMPTAEQPAPRPMYHGTDENGPDESAYTPWRPTYQLHTPTPQRLHQSMADHLEFNRPHRQLDQRPAHNRSRSDMSGFSRGFDYRTYSSDYRMDMQPPRESSEVSRFSSDYARYSEQVMPYQPPNGHSSQRESGMATYSPPQIREFRANSNTTHPGARVITRTNSSHMKLSYNGVAEMNAPPAYGHARNFSTPNISHSAYSSSKSPASGTGHRVLPALGRSQSSIQVPTVPQIRETKETQDLYTTRR